MIGEATGLTQVSKVRADLDFEDFFRSEHQRLLRAMYLLTGYPPAAEDIAQEAFTRAYERWDRVRRMESPTGYVYRIALNLHRKRIRRLMMQARKLLQWPGDRGTVEALDPTSLVETRSDVMRALRSLPPGYREVLVLVHWLGLDAREAGRILGIQPVSVRTQLHRARAAFRDRYGGGDE